MNLRFGRLSLWMCIAGIIVTAWPFIVRDQVAQQVAIFLFGGIMLYFIGVIFSVVAIVKKESGKAKYFGLFFILLMAVISILGQLLLSLGLGGKQ
ncbi:hypothetical protein AWM68_03170 [Fictibacillus phosphorivorans]|uniref:DUF3953 domain-containing protein n=1 Tax=Fictibacillus phosphorivorans TaxID=1221500 RepID=A0A165P7X7_9BACL|nr:hypothetical protein [Fictibacillus phosphorivorans]KZE69283.1 hypothetical protein AWM68_03170 [Fictibacillus phosphorivorans]